jgi:hypothetical protein
VPDVSQLRHLRRLQQPIKVLPQSFQYFLAFLDLVTGLAGTLFAAFVVCPLVAGLER